MKNRFFLIVLAIIASSYYSKVLAQDVIIGVRYTTGKYSFTRQSDEFKTEKVKNQTFGLTVAFSPFLAKFQLISGVEYMITEQGNLIDIPLGCRIYAGKIIRPYVTLGVDYALVFSDIDDLYEIQNSFNLRPSVGLEIAPNKRIRIDIGYFWQVGMNIMATEKKYLPLGQSYFEEYRMFSGALQVELKYRF